MAVEAPTVLGGPINRRTFAFSRMVRTAGYVIVVIAMAVSGGTFFVLMGLTPVAPTQTVVFTVLIINGVLVTLLILAIGWEIGGLVLARRRGRAAARLHIRIIALFSIVAATPAILVAVVASITLDRGLDNWFSTRTKTIVEASSSVAAAFVDERIGSLERDTAALKVEIERARPLLIDSPDRFQTFFDTVAKSHSISGVFLINSRGETISQASLGSQDKFPPPPPSAVKEAGVRAGQIALIAPGSTNIIGSVVKLSGYDDMYIYALQQVDPKIIRYVAMADESLSEYRALESTRFGIQLAFGVLFLGVALVVLLSAIWLGIGFANRLVAPIRRLIDAAKQVSQGNLAVHVPSRRSEGDLGALSETFNTMTAQLRSQREELLSANEQIDSRRRFTEAVMSGATAGIIGIGGDGRITIANRTARRLFPPGDAPVEHRRVAELVPELAPVLESALRNDRAEYRDQISLKSGGRERTINVRVTTEGATGEARGYVITLDDISDLVTAQRSSAWADVARRIAHEIKNPLTPIQLSAERLRRKFGKSITEDREVFDQCTDTIIRQVGDIGRMVDEFSSFARMPKPTFETGNLADSIREAVFLLEVAHPGIKFRLDLPDEPLQGRFDARLMGQALTNVVKNATEAIAALSTSEKVAGEIVVAARPTADSIVVDVIDNGVGLPAENRHRLFEPYMTTREKGTGLGLAIVTKIVEDHGGRIELLDSPEVAGGGRGAMVRITLPRAVAETAFVAAAASA